MTDWSGSSGESISTKVRNGLFSWMPFLTLLFWGCPMEEKFIFYPIARIDETPRDIGLAFDDIFFTTADGIRLNSWFVPYPGAKTTLLWFHGNAGNISHRLENIRLLHDKVKINILIVGRSEERRVGKECRL